MNLDSIKIFCINLESRPDRWAICETEFFKWELRVERFLAIPDHNPKRSRAQSVGAILELAEMDNLTSVLILEDDVEFIHLERCPEPPTMCDLYYLGYTHFPRSKITVDGQWLRLNRDCDGCHAIIYMPQVYYEISSTHTGSVSALTEYRTGDEYLGRVFQPRGMVYCPNPPVAIQRNGRSNMADDPLRHLAREVTMVQYNQLAVPLGAKPILE